MFKKPRNSNAVCFSLAHVLSAFGYEFLLFVMMVRIYELTGSALDVGVFSALAFAPRPFTPYFGSLADRFPRNRLFFLACLSSSGCILGMAAASGTAAVYGGWLVLSVLAAVLLNLRTTMTPQALPTGGHVRGNALTLISLNVARLAAPPVGAAVGLHGSAEQALVFAAAIYAAAATAGLMVRLPVFAEGGAAAPAPIRDGLAYLWRDRDLRFLGSVSFIWRLCLGFQASLLIVYVGEKLGGGAAEYGAMMTLMGAGSLAGAAAGPYLARRFARRRIVVWGAALHFALSGGLGAVTDPALALVVVTAAFFTVYAAAVAVHSIRDAATPSGLRGRVYGCITAITAPAAFASMLAGGWLAEVAGVEPVFLGGGAAALAALWLTARLHPERRV